MPGDRRAKLGWIGAGAIGLPMLKRLIEAGYPVACFDIDPARNELARAAGAIVQPSPAGVAQASDAVFLALPHGDSIVEALFGRDGGVTGGLTGKLVIDTSSIDPILTLDLAKRLARDGGGRWMDVPVSGGVSGAAAGSLVALVGGAASDFDIARPWLASFASRVIHLGPVGSGQWAKLCNQAVICGTIALWEETFALARAGGLEPKVLLAALEGATADSRVRTTFGPEIAAGTFTPSANLQKDIATAVKRAGEGHVALMVEAQRVFKTLAERRS